VGTTVVKDQIAWMAVGSSKLPACPNRFSAGHRVTASVEVEGSATEEDGAVAVWSRDAELQPTGSGAAVLRTGKSTDHVLYDDADHHAGSRRHTLR
jgi:hypothetical protein